MGGWLMAGAELENFWGLMLKGKVLRVKQREYDF
jgi:hypothetical protein